MRLRIVALVALRGSATRRGLRRVTARAVLSALTGVHLILLVDGDENYFTCQVRVVELRVYLIRHLRRYVRLDVTSDPVYHEDLVVVDYSLFTVPFTRDSGLRHVVRVVRRSSILVRGVVSVQHVVLYRHNVLCESVLRMTCYVGNHRSVGSARVLPLSLGVRALSRLVRDFQGNRLAVFSLSFTGD